MVEVEGETLQVKIVDRPRGSPSGKTEAAHVAGHRGHSARERLKREAAALALKSVNNANDPKRGL
jgi:hypothetical protein